jgi:preprotein translocase subunit SecA
MDDVAEKLAEVIVGADLEKVVAEKEKTLGRETFYGVARQIMLQTIDMFWVEHLEIMDYTRSSVNLRAYGQRDPLVEYKREGLRLFKEMQAAVTGQIIGLLPHVGSQVAPQEEVKLKEVHEGAAAAIVASGDTEGNRHARRAMKKQQGK